mmetsp:Transcript_20190/g.32710  ORF Transcript_20190/g.32710 Transcript_20190/m.32710 type:complete len:214 (+) Transcript_20190:890-1531(+)
MYEHTTYESVGIGDESSADKRGRGYKVLARIRVAKGHIVPFPGHSLLGGREIVTVAARLQQAAAAKNAGAGILYTNAGSAVATDWRYAAVAAAKETGGEAHEMIVSVRFSIGISVVPSAGATGENLAACGGSNVVIEEEPTSRGYFGRWMRGVGRRIWVERRRRARRRASVDGKLGHVEVERRRASFVAVHALLPGHAIQLQLRNEQIMLLLE